jgi:hypothetical protein
MEMTKDEWIKEAKEVMAYYVAVWDENLRPKAHMENTAATRLACRFLLDEVTITEE